MQDLQVDFCFQMNVPKSRPFICSYLCSFVPCFFLNEYARTNDVRKEGVIKPRQPTNSIQIQKNACVVAPKNYTYLLQFVNKCNASNATSRPSPYTNCCATPAMQRHTTDNNCNNVATLTNLFNTATWTTLINISYDSLDYGM